MSEVAVAELSRPVTGVRADGRSDGFDSFVENRGNVLWRSAWLLTGDSHTAEDLVQSALAKCWPAYERVDRHGSFEAYVRRTMYTTYVAWWRRRWTREIPSEIPDRGLTATPDLALRRDLVAALGQLPRGQRAVVILRYFEDRTIEETAEILGCTAGTVKSQTARALSAMRRSDALLHEVNKHD